MSKTLIQRLIVSLILSSVVYVGQDLATEAPSISFGSLRLVIAEDQLGNPKELTDFTVMVQPAGPGEQPQHFVVRGPTDFVQVDEQPRGEIVDGRLLVTTDQLIVVFDLATGDQVVDIVAGSKVVVSDDGQLVAFETLQRRFLPRTAISSVIQVLDVPTLQVEPVFPERSTIEPSQSGRLLAWVEEPEDTHSAGKLFLPQTVLA